MVVSTVACNMTFWRLPDGQEPEVVIRCGYSDLRGGQYMCADCYQQHEALRQLFSALSYRRSWPMIPDPILPSYLGVEDIVRPKT